MRQVRELSCTTINAERIWRGVRIARPTSYCRRGAMWYSSLRFNNETETMAGVVPMRPNSPLTCSSESPSASSWPSQSSSINNWEQKHKHEQKDMTPNRSRTRYACFTGKHDPVSPSVLVLYHVDKNQMVRTRNGTRFIQCPFT
jgi:hypothetical protein